MATATELKEEGNRCFLARKYGEAIELYSKAISKTGNVSTFFTNRALCFLKMKNWDLAIPDCKRALEINTTNVKAHYFLGEAYAELGNFDEALCYLQRAFHLAKELKQNFGDDIASAIRLAKRRRWDYFESKKDKKEKDLQVYLNRLIREEENRMLDAAEAAGTDSKGVDAITQQHEKHIADLNGVFAQIDERRLTREVPDSLCGKISFEIMRDPVITPSGITYDKKDIEEHLQRVGHFDPVTRAALTADKLVPNLIMKEVVDNYLEENPWAEDY